MAFVRVRVSSLTVKATKDQRKKQDQANKIFNFYCRYIAAFIHQSISLFQLSWESIALFPNRTPGIETTDLELFE